MAAKSPYQRKRKTPYAYTHDRCAHNHTHTQLVSVERRGVRVEVCNACNTIRDNELNARLEKRRFRGGEERKAA